MHGTGLHVMTWFTGSGHLQVTKNEVLTILHHWDGIFALIFQFHAGELMEYGLSVYLPSQALLIDYFTGTFRLGIFLMRSRAGDRSSLEMTA
jgi:hypothetical protein